MSCACVPVVYCALCASASHILPSLQCTVVSQAVQSPSGTSYLVKTSIKVFHDNDLYFS